MKDFCGGLEFVIVFSAKYFPVLLFCCLQLFNDSCLFCIVKWTVLHMETI